MKLTITPFSCKPLWIVMIFFFLSQVDIHSQTTVFANVISSQNEVDNGTNAANADLTTKAEVRASSGLALGAGAYSGHIELQFPTTVPANTTSYVKIDTDDNLLPALLGGSLGGLLSDVLGIVLFGNQEFTVQAINGNTEVLRGDSQIVNDFASDRLRIVINSNSEYFIAITPNADYDRIRLTNRIGSLLGFFNTKRLGVYGAYYVEDPNQCGEASFTSYDGSGLSLDLISLGGAGVTNPHHVLDNDSGTFSQLSLGILSVAASIEQAVYFEGLSNTSDNFNIRLKVDPSLLAVGVANNIQIIARNGSSVVQSISLTSLLNLDLLTLLQGNQIATIPFSPGAPADRIIIRYNSLLNVQLTQSLDLYDITRTPALPVIDPASLNASVCLGASASLVATSNPTDLELRWYDATTGGNLLATVNSGDPFTTPPVLANNTFYVAAAIVGCTVESARVPVTVTALSLPTSSDVSVTGNENPICESTPVVLQPSSTITGTFSWYFDTNKTLAITDGLVSNGATYSIDANGTLTITGLTETNSPYNYFVSIIDVNSGCENAAGDLTLAAVSIVANALTPTITLNANITVDDTININEAAGMVIINGVVGGDAQVGDTVTLIINNVTYTGAVAADLSFSIPVNGSDLAADSDATIDASVVTNNGPCANTAGDTESYLIDTTAPTVPTVNQQTTSNNTPTITGTADSVDSLAVEVNGITYTEGDGNLVDNGNNTWSLTIPNGNALPDGVYDVVATTTDTAGNIANDLTTAELIIDTTPPTIPTVSPLTTADNTPTISGTADSVDNLTVAVNGITYTEGDGNLADNGNNTWSLTIPNGNALSDGTYDVSVTAIDAAGNTSNDITIDELTINSLAPTNPTVDGQVTNDNTPTVTGTANSVDDLTVAVNGITYTEGDGNLADNGNNTWSLTIPNGNALPDGVYDVAATATDTAGNTANDSTTNELTIDTTPPTTPTVNAQNTNDNTPTITGTADSADALVVEVNGITYTEGDGNLVDNGNNTWSLTIPNGNALPDGVYDVAATATDTAGNTANDTTADELTIDTTPPTTPTVNAQNTNDNTPTITGTANSSDVLVVAVNGMMGTWRTMATIPGALPSPMEMRCPMAFTTWRQQQPMPQGIRPTTPLQMN